jgi:hypothetical protein
VLSCSELSPGTKILFYFKDIVQKDVSRWQIGYIADASDNFVTIRRNRDDRGRGLKIALEDIQLMPTSPLLQRLFEIENFDPEESDQLPGRVSRYRSLQVLRRRPILRGRKRYWLSTLSAQKSGLHWK